MKRRGSVLVVIGIILLALVLVVGGVGFYLYNFYVFKTIRLCVGEGEDTHGFCDNVGDCLDNISISNIDLDSAPEFMKELSQNILDKSVYCNSTCFIRKVRGIDYETQKIEELDSCNVGEVEILIEIHGKEGLEILKYLGSLED